MVENTLAQTISNFLLDPKRKLAEALDPIITAEQSDKLSSEQAQHMIRQAYLLHANLQDLSSNPLLTQPGYAEFYTVKHLGGKANDLLSSGKTLFEAALEFRDLDYIAKLAKKKSLYAIKALEFAVNNEWLDFVKLCDPEQENNTDLIKIFPDVFHIWIKYPDIRGKKKLESMRGLVGMLEAIASHGPHSKPGWVERLLGMRPSRRTQIR